MIFKRNCQTWIQFIDFVADLTDKLGHRHLVERLACGGEGALGVRQDPAHTLGHSLVELSSMGFTIGLDTFYLA